MTAREIWDRTFAQRNQKKLSRNYEPWLEPWLWLFETSQGVPILDLGCGLGLDSQYLTARGFAVIAADYSGEALRMARQHAAKARAVQVDIRDGLPFPAIRFQVIVANLSLHYFPWTQTQQALNDVRVCLKVGGFLCARFNSTKDYHHGAAGQETVEPNCIVVNGLLKRFFDKQDLNRLFEVGWKVHGLEEKVVHCYGRPKVLWEVVVEKGRGSAPR